MRLKILIFFLVVSINNILAAEESFNWYRSGATNDSLKYSDLDQVNKNNVADLHVAWIARINNLIPVQTNPIFVSRTLVSTNEDKLIGINAINGRIKWKLRLPKPVGKRGISSEANLIYVPTSEGIFVVNANSGILVKNNGHTVKYGSSLSIIPPVVTKDFVYVANLVSGVEAFDKKSTQSLWKLSLFKDGVSPRLWSGLSYDEKNKILYLVTSNANGLIDEDIKDGGYSSSLLAVNAISGSIIWKFQDIKHDLWDLDVVGAPILWDKKDRGISTPTIIATTKSGNTIFLNRITGKPIFDDITNISIPKYSKFSAREQIIINKPEPFASIYFNLEKDITDLSKEKFNYVTHKLRNAKNEIFRPVSINTDIVLFGLHGGAEWPGASFNPTNKMLVIPSNKYPWILRKSRFDKHEKYTIDKVKKNKLYIKKCASCHGFNLKGHSAGEKHGDTYFPSLIGTSATKRANVISDTDQFHLDHRYVRLIDQQLKDNTNNIRRAFLKVSEPITNKILNSIKYRISFLNTLSFESIINSVTKQDLKLLKDFFIEVDKDILKRNDLGISANWQLLLDDEGLPGSKPPWGLLTAINMDTGKIQWRKPFGTAYSSTLKKDIPGDMNFGGVMTTKSGLVFASGTRDMKARILDINSGTELWSDKLPAAGSTYPSTFFIDGCQHIVFTATGGKYTGFNKSSDTIVAYKLKTCGQEK